MLLFLPFLIIQKMGEAHLKFILVYFIFCLRSQFATEGKVKEICCALGMEKDEPKGIGVLHLVSYTYLWSQHLLYAWGIELLTWSSSQNFNWSFSYPDRHLELEFIFCKKLILEVMEGWDVLVVAHISEEILYWVLWTCLSFSYELMVSFPDIANNSPEKSMSVSCPDIDALNLKPVLHLPDWDRSTESIRDGRKDCPWRLLCKSRSSARNPVAPLNCQLNWQIVDDYCRLHST